MATDDDDDTSDQVRRTLAVLEVRAVAALRPLASPTETWPTLANVYYELVRLKVSTPRNHTSARTTILASMTRLLAAICVRTGLQPLSARNHRRAGDVIASYLAEATGLSPSTKRPGGDLPTAPGGKRRRYRLYTIKQVLALGRRRHQVPCAACGQAVLVCDARLVVFAGRWILPLCNQTVA